jgi:hypothetical protein
MWIFELIFAGIFCKCVWDYIKNGGPHAKK